MRGMMGKEGDCGGKGGGGHLRLPSSTKNTQEGGILPPTHLGHPKAGGEQIRQKGSHEA